MVKTTREMLNYPIYDSLFSEQEKEQIIDLFESCQSYDVVYIEGAKYLISKDGLRVPTHYIPHYYKLPEPEKIQNLEKDEIFFINGKPIMYHDKYQKARLHFGYFLELAVQVGLTRLQVPFKGNPMNMNHYPHSLGLPVDVVLDNILVECTNPKRTTWMPNEAMLEKIDYFNRTDPHHRKLWVLVTSFTHFNRETQQALKENNIIVMVTGVHVHSRNYKRVSVKLGKALYQLNQLTQHENNQELINKILGYTIKNNNPTIYQPSLYMTIEELNRMCGLFLEAQESEFSSSFCVAG